MDEVNLRRLLRHAMANHIFKEVSPGVVAHTAASKVLAEDAAINDWIGFCLEDIWAVSTYPSYSAASVKTLLTYSGIKPNNSSHQT